MEKKFTSAQFVPLRIRAYLQTAVISDAFLPLDAILYYHHVRDLMGVKDFSLPGESNIREYGNVRLPILKAGPRDDAWFYACSFAQWPEHTVEDESFYVKRFDLQHSDFVDTSRKGTVELRKGRYKNYHVSIYGRHALYVEWYAKAVPDEITRLLQFCTHLGKKSAQGWGSVLKWEVLPWPEDWSIRGPGNKLMRAVPVLQNGFLYGVRPSYWNPRHIFPCKMPDV